MTIVSFNKSETLSFQSHGVTAMYVKMEQRVSYHSVPFTLSQTKMAVIFKATKLEKYINIFQTPLIMLMSYEYIEVLSNVSSITIISNYCYSFDDLVSIKNVLGNYMALLTWEQQRLKIAVGFETRFEMQKCFSPGLFVLKFVDLRPDKYNILNHLIKY